MKRIVLSLIAGIFSFVLITTSALAGKPKDPDDPTTYLGNGFPSGPHYNLLLHGKKSDYQCAAEQWVCTDDFLEYASSNECNTNCLSDCVQEFGNVINIPFDNVDGDTITDPPITILMESGRKGPKNAPEVETLQVTDSCAGFGDGDNTASFRLPKNADGYAAYVRITGKPGDDTKAIFTNPDFYYVEDETGNDLIALGAIVGSELATIDADNITVYRSESTSRGNKVPKATDISRLFWYVGTTCYFESYDPVDDFDYCWDNVVDQNNICTEHQLCCLDEDFNGIYESCELFTDIAIDIGDGTFECPDPYFFETAQCREYTEEEEQWVFNIADFVGMLWDIGNNNAYNIQLRFYPLPLQ